MCMCVWDGYGVAVYCMCVHAWACMYDMCVRTVYACVCVYVSICRFTKPRGGCQISHVIILCLINLGPASH